MTYARPSKFSSVFLVPCGLAAMMAASGCSDDAEGDGDGAQTETGTASDSGGTEVSADETGTGEQSTGPTGGSSDDGQSTGEPVGVECINDQFVNGASPGPDYSEFGLTIGSHCQGTNHQDITDIERVVFVGDSVTVGTPPTGPTGFYRSIVADELATMFGLEPPEDIWQQVDILGGTSSVQQSGDFASCAVWGARNDDLLGQLDDCFATEDFDQRTLVVMTMGGNDVSSIAQDAIDGVPINTLFEDLETMVAHHEEAMDWMVGDPGTFPNGIFVVNANVYEYTDYTLDVLSCPSAGLAGFDANPKTPDVLLGSLNLINEEYARISEQTGTDMVFMFESFCGHGFHADDPNNVCYRGPGSANWFDFTCIHPTPVGHGALAQSFIDVIAE
ncbi:MAG: SGNH/GDSL hydrolase family protein [Deltaproteobacteria bacterium]|nr:SGNH/GDSL hydrolase family protein [Deltaproteobacteria bacterium]